MEKINWPRVVLGGVLAGLVLITLTTASAAVFMGQRELRAIAEAMRPSVVGVATPAFFVSVFLLVGVLVISAYAAIRPRFGSGPKTAALAALFVWLTAICIAMIGFSVKSLAMGQPYPLPSGPKLPCIYLGMIVTSTVIGSWFYKEQQGQ